jgi:nitroreductase
VGGTWKALEESLVLAPSSYGLQPYRFVVVADSRLRERLRPVSWGQSHVTDASHLVVFAAQQGMTEADVDRWIARLSTERGVELESLATYRDKMVSSLVKGSRRRRTTARRSDRGPSTWTASSSASLARTSFVTTLA